MLKYAQLQLEYSMHACVGWWMRMYQGLCIPQLELALSCERVIKEVKEIALGLYYTSSNSDC